MVNASFVFGFDEDEPGVFERTVEWAVSHGLETATFHVLTPYPGTALYDKAHSLGLIPEVTDWADFDHHSPENFFMAKTDREVFQNRVMEMVEVADRHRQPSFQKSLRSLKTNSGYFMRNPNIFFGKLAGKLRAQMGSR
jgi:hypothetical protein